MEPISPELIQKYLRGACSPEEEEIVLNWYNSFESGADPYTQLTLEQQKELQERMLINIKSGLNIGEAEKKISNLKILKNIGYFLATAAAILLFLKLPGFFENPKNYRSANSVNKEITITNHTQSIYKHLLPDKSIVWLSPGAQIKYHEKFRHNNLREVNLSGESFFEVTKDKVYPFVIYSDHITTRVWGTSFRVRDIKSAYTAEVAVVTGKVSVIIAGSENKANNLVKTDRGVKSNVMLLPRQKVLYEANHNSLKVDNVARLSSLNMWKKANLSFDKTPLRDVIRALNKQFNVQIELQDKILSSYILQADFNDQSLPDIMEMLKKLLKLTFVTDGKKFTLQKES